MTDAIQLLVGTRKGAWIYRSDPGRTAWRVQGPIFLGSIINHLVLDPRDGRTLLMAASTGHLGPTIFRSADCGETWTEAARPPAFPKSDDPRARSVDHTFWLEPGHADEPGVWWAGASPPGLFRSADGGKTWESVAGFNDHLNYWDWCPPEAGTPDGSLLNQVVIDPRDARHMYIATSSGGVFESLDQAQSWRPLNENVEASFFPDPYPEFGQDAHYIALAPANPDRLWQQNHCGIYRLDRPGTRWERIGKAMPPEVGDIGFTVVPHARDAETAWVWPMDGTDVWPRVSPGGRPAAYRTRDGGATWERQGLPGRAGLVHGQAPGLLRRPGRAHGPLPGRHQRRDLDERRRGRELAPDRRPPAGDLFGGRGAACMTRVLIPSQLTSYTGGVTRVEAAGATVADLLDDLDRRYPGLKFRVIDEQDCVRKHMRIFIGREETRSVAAHLGDGDELLIFGALSGG